MQRYFAGENPVGKHIRWGDANAPPMTMIGVVGDIREDGMDRPPQPGRYRPRLSLAAELFHAPATALRAATLHPMVALRHE